MSTTYHAAAIIGCRIDRSRIFLPERVKRCEHPSDGNAKFCSRCGQKMWKSVNKPIPQYDINDNTIGGLKVFGDDYDDHVFVAGSFVSVDQYGGSHHPYAIIDAPVEMLTVGSAAACGESGLAHTRLRKVLIPLGLWDDGEQFGIWVVMWCT